MGMLTMAFMTIILIPTESDGSRLRKEYSNITSKIEPPDPVVRKLCIVINFD